MNKKEQKSIIKGIAWLMIGVVGALSISAMVISGTFNLDCFYDAGEIEEPFGMNLTSQGTNLIYADAADSYLTVSDNFAVQYFQVSKQSWNYWKIDVSNLNSDDMTWIVSFYNQSGISLEDETFELKNGENIISLTGTEFGSVKVELDNQEGTTFRIDRMQFSQNYPVWNLKDYLKYSMICMIIYILVTGLISMILRKKRGLHTISDTIIGTYQDICIKSMEHLTPWLGKWKISDGTRHGIRVSCFFIWVTYFVYMINTGKRVEWHYMNYILSMLIVLIIGLVSVKEKPHRVRWNKPLVISWMTFLVMVCISDFIVPKRWSYVGYAFLFVWGFVFFLWSNMDNPSDILRDICTAMQIHFVLVAFFCFLCRPQYLGLSYLGLNTNPNIFGFYLVVIIAVGLTCLERMLIEQKHRWKLCLLGAEGILVFFFLWKTQCRGAFLAALIIGGVFACRIWLDRRNKTMLRNTILVVVTALILFVPIWNTANWITFHVPQKLGTTIINEIDSYKTSNLVTWRMPFEIDAYAADGKAFQRMSAKSVDELLSGRITIWRGYLRQMNLWGHSGEAVIHDMKIYSHNATLAIMYRYGVLAIIPYLIMWIMVIVQSIQYMRKCEKHQYAFLPFALCMGYLILAQTDALEQPWRDTIWLLTYFIMGILFVEEKHEETVR